MFPHGNSPLVAFQLVWLWLAADAAQMQTGLLTSADPDLGTADCTDPVFGDFSQKPGRFLLFLERNGWRRNGWPEPSSRSRTRWLHAALNMQSWVCGKIDTVNWRNKGPPQGHSSPGPSTLPPPPGTGRANRRPPTPAFGRWRHARSAQRRDFCACSASGCEPPTRRATATASACRARTSAWPTRTSATTPTATR